MPPDEKALLLGHGEGSRWQMWGREQGCPIWDGGGCWSLGRGLSFDWQPQQQPRREHG